MEYSFLTDVFPDFNTARQQPGVTYNSVLVPINNEKSPDYISTIPAVLVDEPCKLVPFVINSETVCDTDYLRVKNGVLIIEHRRFFFKSINKKNILKYLERNFTTIKNFNLIVYHSLSLYKNDLIFIKKLMGLCSFKSDYLNFIDSVKPVSNSIKN